MPSVVTARLLGALELTVPELDLAGVPDLSRLLGAPRTGTFGFISMGEDDEAARGIGMLEQVRPGAVALVVALARRLAGDRRVASQLSVAPDLTDEADVAARHGAAHLALAAATAAAVLPRVGAGEWATKPPTVLGVAIGTAVLLLRETPMPASYAAALLARVRAEYRPSSAAARTRRRSRATGWSCRRVRTFRRWTSPATGWSRSCRAGR